MRLKWWQMLLTLFIVGCGSGNTGTNQTAKFDTATFDNANFEP
jgi:hypothetical protein